MLPLALATLLVAGPAPDAKVSYEKKVMVDPNYKSTHTKEQIEQALGAATKPRPSAAPRFLPVPAPRPRVRYVRHAPWWEYAAVTAVGVGVGVGVHHAYRHRHHRHHYRHHRYHRHRSRWPRLHLGFRWCW